MAYLRLKQSGWTTFTGTIGSIAFANGDSVADVSAAGEAYLAANLMTVRLDGPGGNEVAQAGEAAAAVAAGVTRGARPTTHTPAQARIDLDALNVRTITGSTYTLIPGDQGWILNFSAGCVVTVPASLPSDFVCSIRQGGASQVSMVAGAGASLQEIDGFFKTEKQLAIVTLARFPDGSFQLLGRTG